MVPRGPGLLQGGAAVHIGRQPIFDAAQRLHGYELLFRRTGTSTCSHRPGDTAPSGSGVAEDDAATTTTILAAFSAFDLRELLGARPGFVNLTRAFLTGELPVPFSCDIAVLEVLENIEVDDELIRGVDRLAADGYSIALDDFVYRPGTEPLLETASIVKVDVLGTAWDSVEATAAAGAAFGPRLLAERVEDHEMFDRCRGLGFDLFQGYHLGRPETLTVQTLTPAHAMLLQALALLSRPDTTAAQLEASLRQDPALTFRLLKIANSAARGGRARVRSVRDAVVLVGLAKLRSWIVLLSLSGSARAGDALASALAQAYSCEHLAFDRRDVEPDEAFTLGLLDGLGRALGLAPQALPELMPVLDPDLAAALAGAPSPLRRVLEAVQAYQRGDTAAVQDAGWPLHDVAQAYLHALAQAAIAEQETGI